MQLYNLARMGLQTLAHNLTGKKCPVNVMLAVTNRCNATCPYCQIQFDQVQSMMAGNGTAGNALPSILYAQLLGLCMGVDEKSLGLEKNQVAIENVTSFFITQE